MKHSYNLHFVAVRPKIDHITAVRDAAQGGSNLIAGFADLWTNALVLTVMGCTTVLLAAREFVNQRGR